MSRAVARTTSGHCAGRWQVTGFWRAGAMPTLARMAETSWDVIVVGGGPSGEVVAGETARRGHRTVLVERELLGGECSYWACIPSKVLLRPGELWSESSHAPGIAERLQRPIDARATLAARDDAVSHWDDSGQVEWAEKAKVEVVRGRGRLAGERVVEVETPDGTRRLRANKAVVLSTGSVPRIPDIPGLKEARPWTNREGTGSKKVPPRLAIIGAGAVACELAQAWSSLGAKVTILVRGERLLASRESFVSDALLAAFRQGGIDVRMTTEATRVERKPDGAVQLELSRGGTLEVDELLCATGRLPATRELGLETVGLTPGKRVEVDARLQAIGVGGGWLLAVGDVNGRNAVTHMSKYQARIAAAVIDGEEAEDWADRHAAPQIVFTHPQVASVGLTEEQARKAGMRVRCPEVAFDSVAGLKVMGKGLEGRARLVIDAGREIVVGATFLGPSAGELLHAATIAIAGEVPLERLWHAVPSFPSLSELWLQLLETDRDERG